VARFFAEGENPRLEVLLSRGAFGDSRLGGRLNIFARTPECRIAFLFGRVCWNFSTVADLTAVPATPGLAVE
jgi:hypothetical protein